jgi:hypothetical protein
MYLRVVVSLNHFLVLCHDDPPCIFIPYPTYVLQFMGINPWLQERIILLVDFCAYFRECSYEQVVGKDGDVLVVFAPLIVVCSS